MKINFIILAFLFSFSAFALEITFIKPNGSEKKYSIEELKKKLTSEKVRIFNYKTRVFEQYNAFPVREFLPFISGESGIPGDLFITSKNGYKPFVKREHLQTEPGYFAYERINGKMNTIDHITGDLVETGPLYLIWANQKERDKAKGLRWVYQIESLTYNIADIFKEELPDHLPSSIRDGAIIYQTHCMRCHFKGGVAEDLVSPSILHRYNAKKITQYIYDPKSLNPKSNMPSFKKILQDESDVDFIVEYLKYRKDPDAPQYKVRRNQSQELKKLLKKSK